MGDDSTISEIVEIIFTATDDSGIEYVDLLVDEEQTGMRDSTAPYLFMFNTLQYEDGSVHTISAEAQDANGNVGHSEPVMVNIDQSGARPGLPSLFPIEITLEYYELNWSMSHDDDFSSYELFESSYEDMREGILKMTSENLTDTTLVIEESLKDSRRYYQVIVTDNFGLSSKSNIRLFHIPSRFSKVYDANANEVGYDVKQTEDGGYIIAGVTNRYDGDFWLLKLNAAGSRIWSTIVGGDYPDEGRSVSLTQDGGYIIAGNTSSYGAGNTDVWVIKTNADGTEEWNRTFGGENDDRSYSIKQTVDGGYIVAGSTNSFGSGTFNMWLVKIDSDGNELWNNLYGGGYSAQDFDVQQTSDDGYIVVGLYPVKATQSK